MPKEIKTRAAVKDIKVLDRTANIGARMKNAFIRSKQSAEATQEPPHNSPSEYATDRVTGGAKDAAHSAMHRLKNSHKKATQNINRAKQHFQEARRQLPKQRKQAAEQARQTADTAKNTAEKLGDTAKESQKVAQDAKRAVTDAKHTLQQTRQAGRQTVQSAKQTIRTGQQAEKTIKSTGKGTIKTVKKSVKTAEKTAKTTIKTAKRTAKTAQKSAQAAVKAAKVAERAARAAAKAAVRTAKAAVRATIAIVKAAIAAIKALVMLVAAGGWAAVLIIVIICLIALLLGSIFGIFFSGEDSGNGYTMPMAIQEINQEYADKLAEIRNSNAHDDVQMSGSRADWKEILAVYAVKTTTDPENAQDVATMDEEKKELLRAIFWDMNVLTYHTETREITEVTVEGDGEDFIATEQTVTKTILYITVTHKTAAEMAVEYGFSEQQKAQLAELLSDEYADLWRAVFYGIRSGSEDIVAVAISQIGNVNGEIYWRWYGYDHRVAWCACFVSWCANECGYIDSGILPMFASCTDQGIPWFEARGLWQAPGYIPKPGDVIFFDWDLDGRSEHVGIVEYVEGNYVYTVEGNTGNKVARRSYWLDSVVIMGYGTPLY